MQIVNYMCWILVTSFALSYAQEKARVVFDRGQRFVVTTSTRAHRLLLFLFVGVLRIHYVASL